VSKIVVREESYDQVIDDIVLLLVDHWNESSDYNSTNSFLPNFKLYKTMYDRGKLRILTARFDNKLVGYTVWILQQHPHSSQVTNATADLVFLSREYRKGWVGYRMIKDMIEYAKGFGSTHLNIGDGSNPSLRKILGRLGFESKEVRHELRVT